jgi:hypothetical protein
VPVIGPLFDGMIDFGQGFQLIHHFSDEDAASDCHFQKEDLDFFCRLISSFELSQ